MASKRDDDDTPKQAPTGEDIAGLGLGTGENLAIDKQTAIMGDNALHDEDEVLAIEDEDATGSDDPAVRRPFLDH